MDDVQERQFTKTDEEAELNFPDGNILVGTRLDGKGNVVTTNGYLILCLPVPELEPLGVSKEFTAKIETVTPAFDEASPTIRLSRKYLLRIMEAFHDSESIRIWIKSASGPVVIKGDGDGHAVLMPLGSGIRRKPQAV